MPFMNKRPSLIAVIVCLVLSVASVRCSRAIPESQLKLGIWAANNNLWEEALFRWKKEVAARPGSAATHNNLAVALEKKGQWEAARQEYEAALKLAPDNAQIKTNFQRFKENLESPAKDKEAKGKDADEKK